MATYSVRLTPKFIRLMATNKISGGFWDLRSLIGRSLSASSRHSHVPGRSMCQVVTMSHPGQNQVKRVLLIACVEIEETSAFACKYLKSSFGETEIKKTRNISFQSKFSGKLSCPLPLSPPHGVIVMNFVKTKPLNWNPLYIPVIWHKKEKSQNKILMKGNGRFSDSQTWMDHAILFIKRTPFVDIN